MQQEMTIQELNEIICSHEVVLELLQRDLATLKEQFFVLSPSVSRDTEREAPPPHY
jgi:SlyX protein